MSVEHRNFARCVSKRPLGNVEMGDGERLHGERDDHERSGRVWTVAVLDFLTIARRQLGLPHVQDGHEARPPRRLRVRRGKRVPDASAGTDGDASSPPTPPPFPPHLGRWSRGRFRRRSRRKWRRSRPGRTHANVATTTSRRRDRRRATTTARTRLNGTRGVGSRTSLIARLS